MLYALTVTYATAFVTSVVSVILALLVLRTERIRRGVFEVNTNFDNSTSGLLRNSLKMSEHMMALLKQIFV